MFPEFPSNDQSPGYRQSSKSSEQNLTLPRCVKTLNLSQLANCLTSEGKNANYDEGNPLVAGIFINYDIRLLDDILCKCLRIYETACL